MFQVNEFLSLVPNVGTDHLQAFIRVKRNLSYFKVNFKFIELMLFIKTTIHLKSMTKKIIISYFPRGLKYIAPIFAVAGVWLIVIQHPIWGILLIILAAIILITNYVTEISLMEKSYRDYVTMMGVKLNIEENRFNQLDRIVITKGSYAQTINTRVQSRQMAWAVRVPY